MNRETHILEVTLTLFLLHGAFLVKVDDPGGAFGFGFGHHFFNDFFNAVSFRFNGTGKWITSQSSKANCANFLLCRYFWRHAVIVNKNEIAINIDNISGGRIIEWYNGNVFFADLLPDIQLCPVGDRKDPDTFTLVNFSIIEVPEFRPLIFGIPLMGTITEGEYSFFGP